MNTPTKKPTKDNATPEDGVLTVTVLENSNQLIRFKVSAAMMKIAKLNACLGVLYVI